MRITFFILVLYLFACSSKKVEQTEIYSIREIGKLSTSEYTLSKVLKWDDLGEWYQFGDRKILISCKAVVKAGIDLSQIKDKDILVEGEKRIQINLPPPQIISFHMNPNQVKTEMVEVNGFRTKFSQLDKSLVLKKGEQSIRKDIEKLNILNQAEQNAKTFLVDFYKNLGFEEVIIHETPKNKRNTNIDR